MKKVTYYNFKISQLIRLTCAIFLLVNFILQKNSFGQTNPPPPVPTPPFPGFSCSFNSLDGNTAFKCATIVEATVNIPFEPPFENFDLIVPNTFSIIGLPSNCELSAVSNAGAFTNYAGTQQIITDGQLIRLRFNFTAPDPLQQNIQCQINFQYRNCNNYSALTNNAQANTSNLFFSCEAENPDIQNNFYRPTIFTDMVLTQSGLAAKTIDNNIPAIEITTSIVGSQVGIPNEEYDRQFQVKLNSQYIQKFDLKIDNEADIMASGLFITNGQLSSSQTSFVYELFNLFNVNELNNDGYVLHSGNTRTITFRQNYTLNCLPSNVTAIVAKISCDCGNNEFLNSNTLNLNAIIQNTQPTAEVSTTFSSSEPQSTGVFCPNSFFNYHVQLSWSQTSTSAILNSISIPINTTFFNIESITIDDNSSIIGQMTLASPGQYAILILNNYPAQTTININVDEIYHSDDPEWINFERIEYNNLYYAKVNPGARLSFTIKLSANCQNSDNCTDPRISLTPTIASSNKLNLKYSNLCFQELLPVVSLGLPIISAPPIQNLQPTIFMTPSASGASPNTPIPFIVNLPVPSHSPFNINTPINTLSCSTTTYRLRIEVENLPPNASIGNNSVSNLTINNQPANAIVLNNEILIDIPALVQGAMYILNFSLSNFPCPIENYDPNNPNQLTYGTLTLKFTYQAVCSSCNGNGNDCVRNLGCGTQEIFVHCPGECDADIGTDTDVEVRRNTFGWKSETDYQNNPNNVINNLAEFNDFINTINTPNITITDTQRDMELTSFYPYDILYMKMDGETQYTDNYDQFDVLMSFNQQNGNFNENFLDLIEFSLKFINSSNQNVVTNVNNTNINYSFPDPILQQVTGYPNDRWVRRLSFDYSALNLAENTSYIIEFEAKFRIKINEPGFYPLDLQLQFALRNSVSGFNGLSCDPRNRQIRIIVPKVTLEEVHNYESEIFLPSNPPNSLVFNSGDLSLPNTACKLNSALGIKHGGGMGSMPDFNYEYRPLSSWPVNVDATGIDNIYGFIGTTDTYTLNSGIYQRNNPILNNPNLINTHSRLQIPNNQYKGLVLRLNKECPNSTSLNYPQIPINQFAYIHSGFNLNPLPVPLEIEDFTDLTSIGLNCEDVFQFGTASTIGLANGTNNYSFGIHLPNNLLNLPLAIKITNNAGQDQVTTLNNVTIGNLYESGLPATLDNGWFTFSEGFTESENEVSLQIILGGLNGCFADAFEITFEIKVFCTSQQLQDFILNPAASASCLGCNISRTFQLNTPDLTQTNISNSFHTEDCDLVWELEINNPIDQPDIVLTNLNLHFGSGLIFQHPAEASIISQTGSVLDLNPSIGNFNLVVSAVNGGAYPENTISLTEINLCSGCTLKYKLMFNLSEYTCKILQLYSNQIFFASLEGENRCGVEFEIPEIEINNNYIPLLNQMVVDSCCQNPAVNISHYCDENNLGSITIVNSNPFSDTSPVTPMQAYLYTYQDNILIGSEPNIIDEIEFEGLALGPYTLITFNPYNGAYIVETIVIEDYSFTTSLTANPNPVCQGAPITLTATPWPIESVSGDSFIFEYGFLLSNLPISTNLDVGEFNHTPTISGQNNYTVVVSNGSCSAIATTEVNVISTSISNIIIGSNNFESCNNDETYTSEIGTTLNILEINGIQFVELQNNCTNCFSLNSNNSITINWFALNNNYGGTVSFEISNDCHKVVSEIEVNPCCDNFTIFENKSISEILNLLNIPVGINTIENETFTLAGSTTIDVDVNFINCNIALLTNAQISNNGNFNASFINCNLRACDYRWLGIKFNNGTISFNNTNISDASNGIEIYALGSFELFHSNFFSNYTDIYIHDIDMNHPLGNEFVKIEGTFFEGGNNLAPVFNSNPNIQNKTLRHLFIKDIPENIIVNIGKDDPQVAANSFNLNNYIVLTGMYSAGMFSQVPIYVPTACIVNRNSNLSIKNCLFRNAFNGIDNKCSGDYSINVGNYYGLDPSYDYIPKNHFQNFINRAISSYGSCKTYAYNNTIQNCNFGIFIEENNYKLVSILANRILGDFNTAIQIKNSSLPNTSDYDINTIAENVIINTNGNLFGDDSFGIVVKQLHSNSVFAAGLYINDNNIQNVNQGIWTIGYLKLEIKNNRVHILPDIFSFPINVGVWIENCTSSSLFNNVVNSVSDYFAITGFRIDNSPNISICGNQAAEINTNYKIGDAFVFLGTSSGAYFHDNHMNYCLRGVYLGGNAVPMGEQGNLTTATANTWNAVSGWHTYFHPPVDGELNKIYNPGNPAPWTNWGEYYPSAYTFEPGGFGAIVTETEPNPYFNFCYVEGNAPEEYAQRIPLYEAIAADSAAVVGYSQILKYNTKERLKYTIMADEVLQQQFVLSQFSDSLNMANLGYIIDAKNSFSANMNATDSLFFINKISDIENSGILAEELNKEVLTILANNVSFKDSIYNTATLNRLKQIANYCPYTKGSAVYTARHILASINPSDVFYFNPCEIPVSNNGARIAPLDVDDEIEFNKSKPLNLPNKKAYLQIIPNPNNGKFFIDSSNENSSILEIFSVEGKKLLNLIYLKNQEYDLSFLSKGIYILTISDNNGFITTQKLIIQ